MQLKNLIYKINSELNIKLYIEKQMQIKSAIERQVGYICVDKNTLKKYWLTIAFSQPQIYRLKKTIENITNKTLIWNNYFDFNLPILYGNFNTVYYVLYPYIESSERLDKHSIDILFDKVQEIYKNEKYTVKLNAQTRNKILNDMLSERCLNDSESIEEYKKNSEFIQYKKLLEQLEQIELVRSHCDLKPQNILKKDSKLYLIGFEFGGIDLPVGFDLYCLNKISPKINKEDIPYYELHELFYKIHHVGNNASWLKKFNPIIKIDNKNTFIKIREEKKTTTIPIDKRFGVFNYDLTIDFTRFEVSPSALYKLVNNIKKRYDSRFTIYFKNCPYWFDGLVRDNGNNLSFSGIINKKAIRAKNLKEWILTNQAYINYSRILPYVKPYWFRALLAVLICIPIGSLDAVIALSLKPYMDLVMVEKTVQSPWYIPFGIVAFTSIQGLLNYLATYLNTWVGGKITNDLKFTLYKKMLTFETAYFDKKKSGDIVFRFNNDADSACAGLLDNLKTFVSRLFSSLSLIGVLFYNSWQLAIIAIVILGCAFLPIASIQKRIKSVIDKSVSVTSAVISSYNESYAGNKTIISYNLKRKQEFKFKNVLNNIFDLKIKLVQRTSWLSPMMHVIVSIGIGLAIGYGSHLILTNQITSGNFVSFITALIMLYTPIKNLGNNFNAVQFSFLAIERIFSILNLEPKIKDCENAIKLNSINNKIEFNNVNFEYVKNRPVLKNLNLSVNKGQTIAFVGNSGGGKSTIVSLLPRFYDVNSGSITIDNIDIKKYTLDSLHENIAVVFQDNFLFSGTIKENILLGNENATEDDLKKAAKMAYLEDFINELKDGINTQVGERGILLSGGQKQRVAIARAFLKDAPIIILDEATSALDNKTEAIVQKAIDNLMKDKTVFVIAHRLSTIQNADKIAVINEGELVELGSHEELIKIENGQYKHLYEMQFKKQEIKL